MKRDPETTVSTKKIIGKLDVNDEEYKVTTLPAHNTEKAVVLVQFKSVEVRNSVLEKRKMFRLNTENSGINNMQTAIYINEDLSRPTRIIFRKARELKKNGYRYVWCKDGQIYARKKDGDDVIKIVSVAQVDALIS